MDSETCPESHEDTISEFPDEILLHILSYLPTEDIVTTLALSTRWQSVVSLLPSDFYFDFDWGFDWVTYGSGSSLCIPLDSCHDFLVQTIPHGSRIQKFCLRYPLLPDNNHRSMLECKSLLCGAARHKIEKMKLEFVIDPQNPYQKVMSLPHSLFTSDSLTSLELTMTMEYENNNLEFECPRIEFPTSIWWLPSLRNLHIEWFQDWEKLILPDCPVLEELILRCRHRNIHISIASARLQRLTIEGFMPHDSYSSLQINCPNLEYLNISDWCGHGDIQVCDLYSLAEADIDIDCEAYFR
ncbi:hypothetical protein COLO4_06135 [Corchorus olitorius]|uniref:F-box domain-containing protein n=1 Tax=Corchorus olitorius TaxID=93759 RepID=A0A1R3KNV3_9ROSI|nr:hypothetical protein COLO4_06135 [Corchorus olitorius]